MIQRVWRRATRAVHPHYVMLHFIVSHITHVLPLSTYLKVVNQLLKLVCINGVLRQALLGSDQWRGFIAHTLKLRQHRNVGLQNDRVDKGITRGLYVCTAGHDGGGVVQCPTNAL